MSAAENGTEAGARTIRVCRLEELAPGEAVRACDDGAPIAVFNVDGELFALDDTCSHAKSSLAEDGYIDGDVIECGWHYAKFSIRTGDVLGPPARRPLRRHDVRVVDGEVFVDRAPEADE